MLTINPYHTFTGRLRALADHSFYPSQEKDKLPQVPPSNVEINHHGLPTNSGTYHTVFHSKGDGSQVR